jgi:hypothetical protein
MCKISTETPVEENARQKHTVVQHCRQGAGGSSGSCGQDWNPGRFHRIQSCKGVGVRSPLGIPE